MTPEEKRERRNELQRIRRAAMSPEKKEAIKAQKRAYMKARYAANPDPIKERTRAWQKANPEREKAKRRAWREENLEREKETQWRYFQENKDQIREMNNRWRKANPDKTQAYQLQERARRRDQRGAEKVTPEVLKQRISLFDGCAYCGAKQKLEGDHFIPLNRGGLHEPRNIVGACRSCNASKNDSEPEQWYRAQSFFDPGRWARILEATGPEMSSSAA